MQRKKEKKKKKKKGKNKSPSFVSPIAQDVVYFDLVSFSPYSLLYFIFVPPAPPHPLLLWFFVLFLRLLGAYMRIWVTDLWIYM